MTTLKTHIALRNRHTGRLYKDHACYVATTSNVLLARMFDSVKQARDTRDEISEDFGDNSFDVIKLQVDYTYSDA